MTIKLLTLICLLVCPYVICFHTFNHFSIPTTGRPYELAEKQPFNPPSLKPFRQSRFSLNSQLSSSEKSDGLNIPNMLTVLRLIAIPFFIVNFALNKKGTSVCIYVLSCITDFLDGYLARKWNQMTAFGAFLDPVADKVSVRKKRIK